MSDSKTVFDTDDLRPMFKFIGKNWYLLILFPAVFFAIAFIYSYRLPNIFAAKADIYLESSKSNSLQNSMPASFSYMSLVQDVVNQKRVLKSYDLIDKTIDKLYFDISYYLEGGVKQDEVLGFRYIFIDLDTDNIADKYKNTSYAIEVLDADTYEITYLFQGTEVKNKGKFNQEIEVPFRFNIKKTKFFTSDMVEEVKKRTYKFYLHKQKSLVSKYSNNLTVSNDSYSSILSLKLTDNNDLRAKVFLDTLCQVYLDYTIESQVDRNLNKLKNIEIQLTESKNILDSLEFKMLQYRQTNKIYNLSREQEQLFSKLTELETEKRIVQLRKRSIESVNSYTLKELNDVSLPPIINSKEDVILSQQVNTLYELKLERLSLLSNYKRENYLVKKQDTLINKVSNGIGAYLKIISDIVSNNRKEIESKIFATQNKLSTIPESQQGVLGIQRELDVNDKFYEFLLEQRASTIIARSTIVPQVRITEKARSLGTVGPNRNKIRFAALGMGLILALVIGFVRLLFFERIENLNDFKTIANLPVLGGLPQYDAINEIPLAIIDNSRSNVSEAFRALRANLQYILKSEKSVKKILISSLHPSEGKTFVSTNLASFLASSNKKVVLLDFDMHKPKVHKSLKLKNRRGLSSFLIGKLKLDQIINYGVFDNLDVITAGPIPPNASDLILNESINDLLIQLEELYDYIIFDTPPLMLISDSLVLLEKVDQGLFVFNTEKATKEGLKFLEDVLEQNNLSNIAFILNNIKQKKWSYYKGKYYSYRHSYKYGYGSGYGYSSKDKGYGNDYDPEEEE